MVTVLRIEHAKSRTFGWVQNPSNFRSLCNVVAVFNSGSPIHFDIKDKIIPALVSKENGQTALIDALNEKPLKLSYSDLVGTGKSERATAPCNGIIQAVIPGQGKKQYTDNWTADGFIRWAHCLGFINYDYTDDTFSISETGLKLTEVSGTDAQLTDNENRVLTEAILSYPPAIRVLTLLSEQDAHLTKFEIGSQLGFIGEGGFTSMPQNVFIRSLAGITDTRERNSMRNNWEGSSDKYARMIASWLIKLGFVEKAGKSITVTTGNRSYTDIIGQAYIITAKGITALHRAKGASLHKRISKTVSFEMFATKGSDREYLRTRRSLIVKQLSEQKGATAVSKIIDYLDSYDITASPGAVCDDIKGLQNIGFDITVSNDCFEWHDSINSFTIPIRTGITHTAFEEMKDKMRASLLHISHNYLSLIDLAYDSSQNRQFEMETLKLLTEECGYEGLHLGGSRKPDGIIYTNALTENYGVIIDTKAYSDGYNLPISQADEMQRYIQENQRRDESENPNKWWEHFGNDIQRFYFMFVSGHFTGRYQEQIMRISKITATRGVAIEICKLLTKADEIKGNTCSLADSESMFT